MLLFNALIFGDICELFLFQISCKLICLKQKAIILKRDLFSNYNNIKDHNFISYEYDYEHSK